MNSVWVNARDLGAVCAIAATSYVCFNHFDTVIKTSCYAVACFALFDLLKPYLAESSICRSTGPEVRSTSEIRTIQPLYRVERPAFDEEIPLEDAPSELVNLIDALSTRGMPEIERDFLMTALDAIPEDQRVAVVGRAFDGYIESWMSGYERAEALNQARYISPVVCPENVSAQGESRLGVGLALSSLWLEMVRWAQGLFTLIQTMVTKLLEWAYILPSPHGGTDWMGNFELREGWQNYPKRVLLDYVANVQSNMGNLPRIRYQGSPASDVGGLTRDFMTRMFQSIARDQNIFPADIKEDMLLPKKVDKDQGWLEAVGVIFAAGLKNKTFTTGKYFHKAVFSMIKSLNVEDLISMPAGEMTLDLLNRQTHEKLRDHYLSSLYSCEMDKEEFLRDYPEANQTILAVAVIARAMYQYLNSNGESWSEVENKDLDLLSASIQGGLSKQILKNAIEGGWSNQREVGRVCSWIDEADEAQLKRFLWAVTGSESLLPGQKLTVREIDGESADVFCSFHTCSRVVNVRVMGSQSEFNEQLNAAISAEGFNEL